MSVVRVRTPISMGGETLSLKVKNHYTVWGLKVMINEFVPIYPHKLGLYLPGDNNELPNEKTLKQIPQFAGPGDIVLNVKPLANADESKKAKKKLQLFRIKKFKEEVAPRLCYARGAGLNQGFVGVTNSFVIHATAHNYAPCVTKDMHAFDVEVSSVDHSTEDVVIPKHSIDAKGNVCVSWTTKAPGLYSIFIKLHGEDILFSPYICKIEDPGGDGKKLLHFLQDEQWKLQTISLLAILATKEEYQSAILNDIGIKPLLALVSPELPLASKLDIAAIFDGLLVDNNSKQKIITQAGYSFAQSLGELAILGCSPMMLQFVARTVASQANLYAHMAKDPNVQDLHIFAQRFSKDVFVILERMLALARKQDIEAARTIMRALSFFSQGQALRVFIADTGLLSTIGCLSFSDNEALGGTTDMVTKRYALASIGNFAADEQYRKSFFAPSHIESLMALVARMHGQDQIIIDIVRTLANLAVSPAFAETIGQHSGLSNVLKLLGETDTLSDWEISTSLSLLPSACDKDEYGRNLTMFYQYDRCLSAETVRLLANLLIHINNNAGVARLVYTGGILRPLTQFTTSVDLHLQRVACSAISKLAAYEECRNAIKSIGGLNSLCTALNTCDIETAAHVVQALAQMPLETKSIIVNVIGDSGIDKLISLLRDQSAADLQRSAAILLASLAGNEDCIQKIVKQGGRQFMSQLVTLVQSGKVHVQTEINPDQVECIKVIGQGVSGVVWKGTWRGQEVAIKKFDEEGIAFNEAEFRSEVALMSVLRHENIVHCMGCCSQPGNLFIVSELFSRGSLQQIVSDKSIPLPIELGTKLALDAANGMRYLHQLGIIHRDLKPGNLLVNEKWQVKVADFGLSRMSSKEMTRGVGTPVYTAPEALAGSNYTQKADVYSFAFVMWELITREAPYAELPPFEAVLLASSKNLRPKIPPNCILEPLIEQCWDRDPSKRPTFDDIVTCLGELLNLVASPPQQAAAANGEPESPHSSELDPEEQSRRYNRAAQILTMVRTIRLRESSSLNDLVRRKPSETSSNLVQSFKKKRMGLSGSEPGEGDSPAQAGVADRLNASAPATSWTPATSGSAAATPSPAPSSPKGSSLVAPDAPGRVRRPSNPDAVKRSGDSGSSSSSDGVELRPRRKKGSGIRGQAFLETVNSRDQPSLYDEPLTSPTTTPSITTTAAPATPAATPTTALPAPTTAPPIAMPMPPPGMPSFPAGVPPGAQDPAQMALFMQWQQMYMQQYQQYQQQGLHMPPVGAVGVVPPVGAGASPAAAANPTTSSSSASIAVSRSGSGAFPMASASPSAAYGTCTTCGCALDSTRKIKDGKPYCVKHITQLSGTCGGCQKPIAGAYVNAIQTSWHPECFRCTMCNQKLSQFALVEGRPVCTNCL